MRPALLLFALVVLAMCFSCGGVPDLPPSSQVGVTITPSISSIPVNGTVDLHGSVTGLNNPTLDWWEQDHHDASGINGSENCDQVTDPALIPNCRFGYLTGSGMVQASSAVATYHAPATPGTYHVTLRAFQMSSQTWGEGIEKRAGAVITVVP